MRGQTGWISEIVNIDRIFARYPLSFHDSMTSLNFCLVTKFKHALIITNNGRPAHTAISTENQDASARQVVYDNILEWLEESPNNKKIAIYAHGGLNSEEDALKRIQVMGPYFKSNGVYPLFLVWKSGLGETIGNILKDAVVNLFSDDSSSVPAGRSESLIDRFNEFATEKTDNALGACAAEPLLLRTRPAGAFSSIIFVTYE